MPFFLIAFAILLSDLLMMIGHCLSLIHKRNQQIKVLPMYQTHYHYINHSKQKSYTPSNPNPIPLHEVTWEHVLKKEINLPLKEHFQNTILTKIAPLQVHKLTCWEKNIVKQCILYNMWNRMIGKNGSVIEWTWKVDFIDPWLWKSIYKVMDLFIFLHMNISETNVFTLLEISRLTSCTHLPPHSLHSHRLYTPSKSNLYYIFFLFSLFSFTFLNYFIFLSNYAFSKTIFF